MPPPIATLVYALAILGLFLLDRDPEAKTSKALWLPIVWLLIGSSRNFSEWMVAGTASGADASADKYLSGNPIDALILTAMLAVGMVVLAARGRRSGAFLIKNGPILLFLIYCLFSVLWSDYPSVAFKRWTKALGNVVMVFIVLTDLNPAAAAKKLLARTGFILIPVSVLVIRYFPAIGRGYDPYTGRMQVVGAVGDKNGLGYDCLVFGLGALWCFIEAFQLKTHRLRHLFVHGTMLATVFWLLHQANSATSLACFLMGAMLMLGVTLFGKGRPARVHLVVAATVFTAFYTFVILDGFAFIVHALGRSTDLTGRASDLWPQLLRLDTSPVFGVGFDSFFLGTRLDKLWEIYWWHPTEAHNGYLEIYLTLGYVGVSLLAILILSGYRNIVAGYRNAPYQGAYRLAFLFVAMVYNVTEAAFKAMNPVWIVFLLTIAAVPASPPQEEGLEPAPEDLCEAEARVA